MMADARILLRTAAVIAFVAANALITLAMVVAPIDSPAAGAGGLYRIGNLAVALVLLGLAAKFQRFIVLPVAAVVQLAAFWAFAALVLDA